MTIEAQTPRKSYSGDAVTVAFPTDFAFLAAADLIVIEKVVATGVETTKTLTTHYTVSGGNGADGTVTMLTAPATGVTLTIVSDPDLTQTLDLVENDNAPAEDMERAYDRLTLLCQRLKDRVDRSLVISEGFSASFSGAIPETLVHGDSIYVNAAGTGISSGPGTPATRAGKLFGYDASGDPTVLAAADLSLNTVSPFAATLLDDADAAAAQTTLGISAFVKTILDDVAASDVRNTLGATTGVWSVPLGGTGQSAYTAGDLLYADTPTSLAKLPIGSNGRPLTADSSAAAKMGYAVPNHNNYLRNPEFRFWQRHSTPTTLTSFQDDAYASDGWYVLTSGGAVNVQAAQVAENPTGFYHTRYVGQFRQADGTARQYGIAQILSHDNCVDLRGKQVTLSFLVRTDTTEVANLRMGLVEWTGTADSVTSDIVSSWAATPTLIANATFINTPASLAVGTSWAQISITVTLGSTFNNLVMFLWTPTAEAQNDDFYVAQAQLVEGPTVRDWAVTAKPFEVDERDCLSYFWRQYAGILGAGHWESTSSVKGFIPFPVPMRIAPTMGSSGVDAGTATRAATSTVASGGISWGTPTKRQTLVTFTSTTASGTTGEGTIIGADTAKYLEASAEL